jgi:hypothetical protein
MVKHRGILLNLEITLIITVSMHPRLQIILYNVQFIPPQLQEEINLALDFVLKILDIYPEVDLRLILNGKEISPK